MPTRFKNIKTTRGRGYDEKLINRLNDSLLAFPIKQRASILGTFIEESGGNPLAKSENGTYQGLAQWGSDRYRITSDNPEVELKNQLDTLRNTIGNTTDGKSWTHGGEGSGYSSLMDAYNDFNNPNLPIDDVFRAFSFGYVRPKGKDESYENRLKVVKQVYDELLREEEANNTQLKKPEIIHTEPRDAIATPYRPEIKSTYDQNIRALNTIDVKKALYRLDKKLRWENQPESPHFVPEGGIDYAAHANGGKLDNRKWDELSLREKSEMMRVAIQNGVTNLKDIRQKYNEFAEERNLKENLFPTGGVLPTTPILLALADKAKSAIRERMYRTVSPLSDYLIGEHAKEFINGKTFDYGEISYDSEGNPYVESWDATINPEIVDDIYATYLQIPEKDRRFKKRLEQSKHKPTIGGNTGDVYYKLPLSERDVQKLMEETDGLPINSNKVSADVLTYWNLADHTVGKGMDENGREYRSYYDKWDLNPFSGKYQGTKISILSNLGDATMGIGKPVQIYDRVYVDDYYGVPNTKGQWLPELDVYAKTKASMWDNFMDKKNAVAVPIILTKKE